MTSPFSGPSRRALPIAGLACSLVLSTLSGASPSRAAGVEARLVSGSSALGIKDSDGGICTQTGGQLADSEAIAGDGRTVSTKHTTTRTVGAGRSDPDDTQTFTFNSSGEASLQQRQGLPRRFSFDGRVGIKADYAMGKNSDCDSIVQSFSYVTLDSTLPPGFVTLEMVVTGDAKGYFGLAGETDPGIKVYGDTPGRVDYTVYVKGDDYQLGLDAGTDLRRPQSASSPTSVSGRVTVRGSYVELGGATTRSTGSAKRFVTLGKSRSCSADTIGAKVTARASRARSIKKLVIEVNDKRAALARNPKPGRSLTLKAPASNKAATVVATVRTSRGKTKTVTRAYAACSG